MLNNTQTPLQKAATVLFYPILKLMAGYFWIRFMGLMLEEVDFHD